MSDTNISKYRESLNGYQQEIISSIKTARHSISHSGEKGGEIEKIVRDALVRVLPEKVGVSHGFVIDSLGGESKQMDIVLYDKMNAPKIYSSENDGVQIFPVESTYACGEVKTKLNSREIENSIKKSDSYKKLCREAYIARSSPIATTHYLFGESSQHWKSIFFCVAYESIQLEKIQAKLSLEYTDSSIDKHIDSVVVINNKEGSSNVLINAEIGLNDVPTDKSVSLIPDADTSLCRYRAEKPWALFVALLLRYMVQVPAEAIDMIPYNTGEPF